MTNGVYGKLRYLWQILDGIYICNRSVSIYQKLKYDRARNVSGRGGRWIEWGNVCKPRGGFVWLPARIIGS
jgi:hypothetical protein